jgi:hypothetical protein
MNSLSIKIVIISLIKVEILLNPLLDIKEPFILIIFSIYPLGI